ncbi:hypothetical protein BJX70DRAFT_374648 [Aspergillus crustosus]
MDWIVTLAATRTLIARIQMMIPLMMRASFLPSTTWPRQRVWMFLSFDRSDTATVLRKGLIRLACTRIGRYCQHISVNLVRHWQWILDSDETVCFLYVSFRWRL